MGESPVWLGANVLGSGQKGKCVNVAVVVESDIGVLALGEVGKSI